MIVWYVMFFSHANELMLYSYVNLGGYGGYYYYIFDSLYSYVCRQLFVCYGKSIIEFMSVSQMCN